MDIFKWIDRELRPKECNSVEFHYDDMASQSGYSLPLIYQPFDATKKSHWRDRGELFDYLFSVEGEDKKLLDFGPGDGWPSLIVAPFAREIVGVDGSRRRVEVCTENARRMGISNVRFIHVEPGSSLPFEEDGFDGIMAASSVEQTPDPKRTLQEFYRVLKSSGRLRMAYESLAAYRGGQEQAAHLYRANEETCRLTLYDRHIDEEYNSMYQITLTMPYEEMTKVLGSSGNIFSADLITTAFLRQLQPSITEARYCLLTHPSGKTLASWLKEIGFREVLPSHSGGRFGRHLFDQFSEEERPDDIDRVDAALKPPVKIIVNMAAPLEIDPMITAIK